MTTGLLSTRSIFRGTRLVSSLEIDEKGRAGFAPLLLLNSTRCFAIATPAGGRSPPNTAQRTASLVSQHNAGMANRGTSPRRGRQASGANAAPLMMAQQGRNASTQREFAMSRYTTPSGLPCKNTVLGRTNDPNCMSNYDYDKSKPEGPGNRTYGGLKCKSPSSPVMSKLLATWADLEQLIEKLSWDIKHGYMAGNVAKTVEFPLARARWWVAKIKNVTHNECERRELEFFEEAVDVHAALRASTAAAERMARYAAGFTN